MIRKVLVYTFGNQSHKATIESAAKFSEKQDAHLMGLFVKPEIGNYSTAYGRYPLNLAHGYFEAQSEFEEKAKAEFSEITSHFSVSTEWHSVDEHESEPNPMLYADFIFIGQPEKERSLIFNDTDFVDYLITATGLPTVIIPKNWSSDSFAQNPVLGWKETREAAGAVRHTLALMREAQNVSIVNVSKRTNLNKELVQGAKISEYLCAHDVNCEFTTQEMIDSDRNQAQALLRHVENKNRDLIIIGGYGHSRLREIILGGMTRELIKRSTVPLLVSH